MDRSTLPRIRLDARPSGLKFRAPPSAVAKWDKSILMKAPPTAGEIQILGVIGAGEATLASVRRQMKQIGRGNLRLILNSPGGDAIEGIGIYNELLEHPGKITVSIRGMAASVASVIAMAGDRIEMGEASHMMIHSAAGMVMGNAADMVAFASLLNMIDEEVAQLYARRSGQSVSAVLAMMRTETYMTAKVAVSKGFADVAIADPEQKPSASTSMRSSLPALTAPALAAASGIAQRASVRLSSSPGVSGLFQGSTMPISLQDQVAELHEQRKAKMTRQGEINLLFQRTPGEVTAEVRQEFDGIDAELNTIEDQIRMKSFEARMAQAAQPVRAEPRFNPSLGAAPYGFTRHIKDQDETFKGQNFTRKIIAGALAYSQMQQGHFVSAADIAQQRWGQTNPTLVNIIRMAAVPGAGTGSGEPLSELVTADNRYTGDFIEFLYGLTVFDRLPLREVPAYVAVKGIDGESTGYWVAESKATPTTQGSASSVELVPLEVGAITVASNRLLANSTPAAEMIIRDQLVGALAKRIDQTFLSATAASAGVSPAGILNGISAGTSAGTSADNIRTDLMALAQNFIDNRNARNLWVVTSPGLGLALKLMKNSLGQPEFDGVTLDGGTIEGFRLIFGDHVGSGDVIMLKPDEIWRIGDTGMQVSFSRDATIEQTDNPTGATDTPTGMTTTSMTNMFQSNSTAIKVIRQINFQKRRTHAVAYIGDAGYGGVAS